MNHSTLIVLGFLLCGFSQAFSQKAISGIVIDSRTSEPLAYVNIGIKNENLGTVTSELGEFSISIPKKLENDTLTFSMVGYQDLRLPVGFFYSDEKIIRLSELVTQLNPVNVISERLVERKFGVKRRNLALHFSDGMFQENDVFEIGQLIKLKGSKSQITSVNLYLFGSKRDSITFRINFYDIEQGVPSKRLIDKSIVQRHQVKEGWLRLDISHEDITLKGNFVVTLEFLPDARTDDKIYYEVRLGGSSRSYYRKNSLGSWNTPPHHYCMYITALVDKSVPKEPVETETLPITSIWSDHVKDSFNIFLRLPSDYERKKKRSYPIIYCLDANAYFDHICQIVEDLSKKNILKVEPIIIGLGYQNAYVMDSLRIRDYTFPKAPTSDSLPISGGGQNFYNFIKSEVIPYSDKNFRTDTTRRTIMGHSFGGYFVNYSLLEDISSNKNTFNNYVAASPSLWYCDGYLIKRIQNVPSKERKMNFPKLFLTIGEEELKFDYNENFKLFNNLTHDSRTIQVESNVYPNLDHIGAAVPAFEDAINSLFGKQKAGNK